MYLGKFSSKNTPILLCTVINNRDKPEDLTASTRRRQYLPEHTIPHDFFGQSLRKEESNLAETISDMKCQFIYKMKVVM